MRTMGVEPNVRSFSAVIDACCKGNQVNRAEAVFVEMRAAGIAPSVVTYTALARPYAQRGNWERVEALKDLMTQHGVRMNAFFLCGLLTAYANASPKERSRAEAEFRRALWSGVQVDGYVLTALEHAMGRDA